MEEERGGIRLQKYLAACGLASRRKCEEIISSGRVRVNGADVTEPGTKVLPGDAVEVDGKSLAPPEEKAYLAFYKPSNVVTTALDPEGRQTALDFFKDFKVRLFPVGRLDYETEGLLLMTNDGEWANRVTHPKFNLDKEYVVKVNGVLDEKEINVLERGVLIEGKRTWPAKIHHVHRGEADTQLNVAIHEGRNRQVRRMMEAVGKPAVFLKRVRVGSVLLGALKPGQWRNLTEEEIKSLGGGLTE